LRYVCTTARICWRAGLITRRSRTIGLLISDIRNPFFRTWRAGRRTRPAPPADDVVLCNSDLDPASSMKYFWALTDKHVDGVIMNRSRFLKRDGSPSTGASGVRSCY
jgi:DNA-binding LacI/PurR family transcriptional regulator